MRFGFGARSLTFVMLVVGGALLACKKKKDPVETSPAAATALPEKPAAPAAPPTPTETFKLNQAATLDGVTLTLEEFKECRLDNVYSRRSLSRKKNKLVGVLSVFEGNFEKEHSVLTSNFKATDPEGLTYRATTRTGSDCSPTLKTSRLGKGDKTKGWVLFEVPEKATDLTVSYSNRRPYRSGADPSDREQRVKFDVD